MIGFTPERKGNPVAKKQEKSFFIVTYRDPVEEKTISLKAGSIGDSSLGLSFIRISDFIFETGSLVVTPEEEALKKRLEDVKSLHLSIYTVLSISEVGASHAGLKFEKDKSNLVVLPGARKSKNKKDP